MRPDRGFTLVELLMVIAILVLLLAILAPSLREAMAIAERTMCASNLHEYGVAIHNYRADSDLQIMKTVHQWGGPEPYPDYIRVDNTADPAWAGEWAVEQIRPYVKAREATNEYVGGIAICPSVDAELLNRLISERNFLTQQDCRFVQSPYLYWGGADQVNAVYLRNGAAEDLADSRLTNLGLLMSDILYFDASDWPKAELGAWRYNHGPKGWAFNEETYLPQDLGAVPNVSGTNQLFGDGGVHWKPRAEFVHLYRMQTPSAYPAGFLRHGNADSFYY